jgi:uncharacterized protein YdeI (YjbR/CyaY-like superfamily)
VKTRVQWRRWLFKHHITDKEIWLVYYKKHSGKPRIPYGDAVEEAICFGWIDSIVRKFDAEKYIQRFTPRRPDSIWSEENIRRAKKMIRLGWMTAQGMRLYRGLKKRDELIIPDRLAMPAGLRIAFNDPDNAVARRNFRTYPPSHKKIYYWWIKTAKKSETRQRRIQKIVELVRLNKRTTML